MKQKQSSALPEKVAYTKYFEHDGSLRAYANRMMWFGISAILISFVLALLVFYVRVQPPTVIRIAANGEASVVSGAPMPRTPLGFLNALAAGSSPGEQPADIEGRAIVRRFLENYLTYTPTTLEKNWADALNMMTHNLRTLTLNQLRDQDIVSKVHDDEITSTFKLRSLEPVKGQPWTYLAFGVKEVHRVAFYAFPQYLVDMIVERTGGRPITVALPSLVDGEVNIDEAGSVYLVDEVSDGAGSLVRRQTLLLQVTGDGRLITDNGRTYHVRPFPVQPGPAQIRNGRLELPNTQQRPCVPILKSR